MDSKVVVHLSYCATSYYCLGSAVGAFITEDVAFDYAFMLVRDA
jgi:hypothetical protein